MATRLIRDGFLDSPRVNCLDWFAECVYHRALLAADHAGRLDGRPTALRHRLFPARDDVSTDDVAAAVERIIGAGLAIRWTAPNGQLVIQLTNWHRDGNASTSRYPGPDGRFEIQYVRVPAPTQSGWIDVVATSVPGQNTDQSATQPTNCGENSPLEREDRIPKPSHADGMGMGSASHPDGIGIPSACHAHPMPMGFADVITYKRNNEISKNGNNVIIITAQRTNGANRDEHNNNNGRSDVLRFCHEVADAASPNTRPILQYPTRGDPPYWLLSEPFLARLERLYPNVDVMAECRQALAWLEARPDRRPPASDMPAFIVGWLNREIDRKNNNGHQESSDWRERYRRRRRLAMSTDNHEERGDGTG